MHDTGWNRIARIEELKEGIPISVKLDKAEIFVVLTGGSVYAMEGKCSHYGGPLREGLINEKAVTCPWHNARFDITTGKMTAPPALKDLRRFPVKVENGDVYLGPPEAASIPGAGKSTESDGRVFAIVGGGAAGNAAAEMLRHEGFPGHPVYTFILIKIITPSAPPPLILDKKIGQIGLPDIFSQPLRAVSCK